MAVNRYYIDKFRGGLVRNIANDNMGPNTDNPLEEFLMIDNYEHNLRGAFVKRNGYSDIFMTNQDLLDLGLSQSDIDANGFDDSMYTEYPITQFVEISLTPIKVDTDGTEHDVSFDDEPITFKAAYSNRRLFSIDLVDNVFKADGTYLFFPSKLISNFGSNSPEQFDFVKFGEKLYIVSGQKYTQFALYVKESITDVWDEYYVSNYAMDASNKIYYPDSNEVSFIGSNILFPEGTPDIADEFSSTEESKVLGIRTSVRQGVAGEEFTFDGYIRTAAIDHDALGSTDYQIIGPDGTILVATDDGDNITMKNYTYTPEETGIYTLRVGFNEALEDKIWGTMLFQVNLTQEEELEEKSYNDEINACTGILLYYNRIIVYGNGTGRWYKSDINRPGYFTVFGINDFSFVNKIGIKETLKRVIAHRNKLFVFTEESVYSVTGSGDNFIDSAGNFDPFIYNRVSSYGITAKKSLVDIGNYLVFLSKDGIYVLNALVELEDKANIFKVSDYVDEFIYQDENASAILYDNKYMISFKDKEYIIKWDFLYGQLVSGSDISVRAWTRDISSEFSIENMHTKNNEVYLCTESGKVLKMNQITDYTDENILDLIAVDEYPTGFFTDDGVVYQALIETKGYDLGYYDYVKKVKKIILKATFGEFTLIYMADEQKIIDADKIPVIEVLEVEGRTITYSNILEANMILSIDSNAILGVNILGGLRESTFYYPLRKSKARMYHKLVIANSQDMFCKILGFGFHYEYYETPRNLNG